MKKYLLNICLVFCFFMKAPNLFTQIKVVKFEQIDSLQKIEKRNLVIFIHTDWCKYCHKMKQTTFKNSDVINELNKSFYFVDFNAEQKQDIIFKGKRFKYRPSGINTGIHELAQQLATINNKITYPALCFLNSKNEIIFQHNQFITSKNLIPLLARLKN